VEAGESQTLLSTDQAISNDTQYVPYLSTSSVLESGFGGACDSARLESDPAKLLPQILDQLIVLGQTAEQLRQVLGGNGQ